MLRLILILLLIPINLSAAVFSIDQWVEFYLRDCSTVKINQACRQNLEKNFGRMFAYKSLTFRYLDKEGLPRWLATVPIVESSYNDKAVSPAGAIGLWQLMDFNILKYKTKNKVIMNRRVTIVPTAKQVLNYGHNPVVSTQIATKHLAMLYGKFSDHKNAEELALMAYNAGERRIRLWMKGQGRLPDETKNYYHKLMALQYILANMRKLKIKPVKQRRILFFEYLKSLTKLEKEMERDRIHLIIKQVLG